MKKNIFFVTFLILCSCNLQQKNNIIYDSKKYIIQKYEIKYSDTIQILDEKFKIGIIFFEKAKQDTLVLVPDLINYAFSICLNENLSYCEFYVLNSNKVNNYIDSLGKKTNIYTDSYFGKLDATQFGKNWKDKIKNDNFSYYNPDNIPIIVKPR